MPPGPVPMGQCVRDAVADHQPPKMMSDGKTQVGNSVAKPRTEAGRAERLSQPWGEPTLQTPASGTSASGPVTQ